MILSKRASREDIPLIHEMACVAFPHTYAAILQPEQIDYMMDWMYSLENLNKQMEEGHIFFIGFEDETPAVYVSINQEDTDLFHLQKIYVLPQFQKRSLGKVLFNLAIEEIRRLHPAPCRMELNVNRYNKALDFYKYMGMKQLRQGDFDIGNGWYMNDYIMGLDIE